MTVTIAPTWALPAETMELSVNNVVELYEALYVCGMTLGKSVYARTQTHPDSFWTEKVGSFHYSRIDKKFHHVEINTDFWE